MFIAAPFITVKMAETNSRMDKHGVGYSNNQTLYIHEKKHTIAALNNMTVTDRMLSKRSQTQ